MSETAGVSFCKGGEAEHFAEQNAGEPQRERAAHAERGVSESAGGRKDGESRGELVGQCGFWQVRLCRTKRNAARGRIVLLGLSAGGGLKRRRVRTLFVPQSGTKISAAKPRYAAFRRSRKAARAYAPVRVMPKCAEAACAYLTGLERARKGV